MSVNTNSTNWGAVSITSIKGGLGLNAMGTIYMFQNFDNNEKFIFGLGDLGFGFSFGLSLSKNIKMLVESIRAGKNFNDPSAFSKIKANKPFSANDLDWACGVEATAGVTVLVAGCTVTAVSAYPFFDPPRKPDEKEFNKDYFTSAYISSSGFNLGLEAKAAYQFMGRWVKLWTF